MLEIQVRSMGVNLNLDLYRKAYFYFDSAFNKIREYQTIEFDVKVSIGGVEIKPDTVRINADSEYLTVEKTTSGWQLTCNKRSTMPLTMNVTIVDKTYNISKTAKFDIQAVSMMG
jgi:hypothetical protein